MTPVKRRKAIPRALYVVLLVAPLVGLQHCVNEEYMLYRFQLDECPNEAFTLPDSVVHEQYELSSMDSGRNYPECTGFKLYSFLRKIDRLGIGQTGIYVRLDRGPSCILEVVFRFDRRRDEEPIRWAEVVANLTMRRSTARPSIPAASKDSLGFFDDFKTWCARSAEGNGRNCGDLQLTEALNSSNSH